MPLYTYKYIDGVVLTRWDVDIIIKKAEDGFKEFDMVLDLGTATKTIRISSGSIIIDGIEISFDELASLEYGFVYKLLNGKLVRIDLYDNGNYYKLKPISNRAPPTLEINGIQMHRTVDIDPWRDTIAKVSSLGSLRGKKVLDICTGLGYSSIVEVLRGAREVISIEKDPNVLYIASLNPWSRGLGDSRIKIVLEDATTAIRSFSDEEFDAIFHDPPRYSVAGELYGLDFYRELYRVLKGGGVLFHYTGEPGKHSNISLVKGIKRRLEQAGFEYVTWIDRAKGFKAIKLL